MAGTYGVGYCRLIIEDAKGQTIRDDDDLYVVCRSGRPDTGNWVQLDQIGRFFVDRVEFLPESRGRMRNHLYPVLFLRPTGARRSLPDDDGPEKRSLSALPSEGTRKVIAVDFTTGTTARSLRADILPTNLVANLTAVGYRVQASDFDQERRERANALRGADARLRDALVNVLDVLSREAKSHAVRCHLFFRGESAATDWLAEPSQATAPARPAEATAPPRHLTLVKDVGGDWQVREAS
jgi:hypothetical protein